MTPVPDEVDTLLASAEELPYGRSRTALVEKAVAQADALAEPGPQITARLALVDAYAHGGEQPQLLVPFEWLLARHDADPSAFDSWQRDGLLWAYRYATERLVAHPDVPRERIERVLDDMERRYIAEGEGLAPVLAARYAVRLALAGPEAAQEAYDAWTHAPRTPLSGCEACEPTPRVRHLALAGRHDEAVAEAMPVLEGSLRCHDQPQAVMGEVLGSLVSTGRTDLARDLHVHGLRLVRGHAATLPHVTAHVAFCALTGNAGRGLDILAEHLPLLEDAPTPLDEMRFAAVGARLLRGVVAVAGDDLPIHPQDGVATTVAVLEEALSERALRLAERFDARNGSDVATAEVRAVLDAEPLAEVPLGPAGRWLPARADVRTPSPAGDVETRGLTLADLADRREQASFAGATADVEAYLVEWELRRDEVLAAGPEGPEAGHAAGLEVAAGRRQGALGDAVASRRRFLSAAALYGRAREKAEAALARQWGVLAAESEVTLDTLERIRHLTDQVDAGGATPEQAARARLREATVARAIGDVDGAHGIITQALERAGDSGGDDPAWRWTVAGLHVEHAELAEAPAQAERHAGAALDLLGAEEYLGLQSRARFVRASALEALGRFDEARETYASAGDAPSDEWPVLSAAARARLGRLLLAHFDEPAAAAEALAASLPGLDAHGDPAVQAEARHDLAAALRVSGHPVEAAEAAETALRISKDLDEPLLDGALSLEAALAAGAMGDGQRAEALAVAAADAHERAGNAHGSAVSFRVAGEAAESAGDHRAAIAHYARAAELAEQAGDAALMVTCRRAVAFPMAVTGEVDAALTLLDEQRMRVEQGETRLDPEAAAWEMSALQDQRVRLLARVGRFEEALAATEGLAEAYHSVGDEGSAVETLVVRGQVLGDLGRVDESVDVLRNATESAAALGSPDLTRGVATTLARTLESAGREQEAEEVLRRYAG